MVSLPLRRQYETVNMGLRVSPLKTSFLAAVQVLAFKVGENDKTNDISHFVNFLTTFSN